MAALSLPGCIAVLGLVATAGRGHRREHVTLIVHHLTISALQALGQTMGALLVVLHVDRVLAPFATLKRASRTALARPGAALHVGQFASVPPRTDLREDTIVDVLARLVNGRLNRVLVPYELLDPLDMMHIVVGLLAQQLDALHNLLHPLILSTSVLLCNHF